MTPLLTGRKKGMCFILSAPAGTGKTTLVKKLAAEFPLVVPSISYTTRAPRPLEIDKKDYFFVSEDEFKRKISNGDFLEYVKLYETFYGTSRQWVEEKIDEGKFVFLVIDTQGGLALKDKIAATYIFIKPPSLEVLKERLLCRATEKEEMVLMRLKLAERELEASKYYDYEIVNDDLETAYQVLKSVVIAESHRVTHSS